MSVSRPRSPSVDCAICLLWLAAALPGLACGGRSPLDPRSPIPLTGATEGGRNGGATAGAGGAAGSTGRRPGLRLVAGKLGGAGDLDGVGAAARFRAPFAVAADGSGQLFVSDRASHVIRRIDIATGRVSTLAGLPGSAGSKDGSGTAARFRAPAGITSDRAGNLFVADADNHTIRKIVTATGAVSTVAGSPEEGGSEDGSASSARFSGPLGVVWDRSGALFVADTNNNVVRRIELASDVVTTLAGEAERGAARTAPDRRRDSRARRRSPAMARVDCSWSTP